MIKLFTGRWLNSVGLNRGYGGLGVVVLILWMTALPGVRGVDAQSLNFSDNRGEEIEVLADNGIEWQQDKLLFIARGNARAKRGTLTVFSDELRAYYRQKPKGGSEVWRLDAVGNVRIKSPKETAYGDKAVFDVDNSILILTGKGVRLETPTDKIYADKQLEYWDLKKMAVARGNARAVQQDKTLRADVLAAYFRKDKKQENKVYRIDAFENVKVSTANDRAVGDRGVYNVESGVATLTGNVKLKRGQNVLKGCRAVVNLNSGVSKLFNCPRKRVKGVLVPNKKRKAE